MANDFEEAFFGFVSLGLLGVIVITLAVIAFFALPFALVGAAILIAVLAYFRSGSYREKKAREHTHQLYEAAKARCGSTSTSSTCSSCCCTCSATEDSWEA